MEYIQTDWTKEEFKAYLLSYAANANYFESEEEREKILEHVSKSQYKKIHMELDKDNDYQSIQKILYNLEKFDYSKNDLNKLVADIKALFAADGEVDLLESNMLLGLQKLLK